MNLSRRIAAVAGAAATTLAPATALPAQATSAAWHVVFTRHYGPAANYSGYLTGVALSKNDAWAFGGSDLSGGNGTSGIPVAGHWDGTAWRASALPRGLTDDITAASADSASDVWTVTQLSGDVLHWNGSSWSVSLHLTPNGAQFTGVTAVSPADVWAFGGGGFTGGLGTWHYNGSAWTHDTSAAGLEYASALSASSIWAVGSVNEAEDSIWHYNGTSWAQVTGSALDGLTFPDILAQSETSIWAAATLAGNSSKSYLVHFNGTRWARLRLPWALDPSRIAADGHGGIWVSGVDSASTSWMAHRSAAGRWSRTEIGDSTAAQLFDPVLIPRSMSLWGFGLVDDATGSSAAVWAG